MPSDPNVSTVTVKKKDGTTYTQTTVKGESGTKIYNTSNGKTYLVYERSRSGSTSGGVRYVPVNNAVSSTETNPTVSSAGGGSASTAPPPTSLQKVPVYAKLNDDGTIDTDIYVKEGDEFKKSQTTTTNEKGETVIQTAQLPTSLKRRIEAGSPTAVTDEAQGVPVKQVAGAKMQTGSVPSTARKLPPIQDNRGVGNALDTFFLGGLKVGASVNPLLAASLQGTTLRSPLTDKQFTVNSKINANVANKPIKSVLEFTANRPAEAAGIAAVSIWGAPYAAAAVKSTPIFQGISGGLSVVEGTKAGAAVLGTAKVAGVGLLATEAGKQVIPIFDPELQQRLINTGVSNEELLKARQAGRQAELASLGSQAWYKGLANEINPLLAGDKKAYKGAVLQSLRLQGYEGEELQNAAKIALKQREYYGYAEAGGILATNAASELLGRKLIAQSSLKLGETTFLKNFAKIGGNIAIAGVAEGATIRAIQTRTRAETTSAGQLALYGAAGGVTAGLLGGAIGATGIKPAVKGKPAVLSKTLLGAAYLTDPYEYAGDKLASGYAGAAKKLLGKQPFTPIVTVTPTQTTTGGRGKSTAFTFTPTFNIGVNTNILSSVVTPTQTDTPTNTPANVLSFVSSNTQVDVNTNNNVLSSTNTPVNVNSPVNIPAAVNIPALTTAVTVAVPNARIPPILPLAFPSSLGTTGRGGGNRRKYVNELAVSGALLKDLTGSNRGFTFEDTRKLLKPVRKTTRRRGRKK